MERRREGGIRFVCGLLLAILMVAMALDGWELRLVVSWPLGPCCWR
jgi:hypothetical protein